MRLTKSGRWKGILITCSSMKRHGGPKERKPTGYTVGTKISATFIRRSLKETGKTRLTSLTPSKATE
jgi:hypothetical protein